MNLFALDSGLGWCLPVLAAASLLPFLRRESTVARGVVFSICAFLSWRYAAWRISDSLPPFDWTASAIWSRLFLGLELASIVSGGLFCLMVSRTKDRRREASVHQAWWAPHPAPRLEILIATRNEERAILERTLLGALAIDHPNKRIWVCDDGARDWLLRRCAELGVRYLHDPGNRHAKAGNLNNALRVLADCGDAGEFVAVLDAAFVAQPNFARRALALFHDPTVAVVQTPQHFFNPDPIQCNLLLTRAWPDEQRFFFTELLACKDAWGIAFCCGTSSILRRAALAEIGGFPTESVTEDYLLSLKLKERGWKTVYLNEKLSVGLAPEGLGEYVTQRGRWCLGFMQIMRSPWGPFSRNRLSCMDRVGLVDTFLYWAATYPYRLAGCIAPILYWMFGIVTVDADLPSILSHFGPYWIAFVLAQSWVSRGLLIPVLTDLSQILALFEVLAATVAGLTRPRGQPFRVTAKGGDRDKVVVQWRHLARFGALAALSIIGMAVALGADYAPGSGHIVCRSLVISWTYYNLLVLMLAIAVCVELPRGRLAERFSTSERAYLVVGDAKMQARLQDLSLDGARIRCDDLTIGQPGIAIILAGVGPVAASVVASGSGGASLVFHHSDGSRERLTRKLFSGRYQAQARRVSYGGILAGVGARLAL